MCVYFVNFKSKFDGFKRYVFTGNTFVYRNEKCGFCAESVATRSDVSETALYWILSSKRTYLYSIYVLV